VTGLPLRAINKAIEKRAIPSTLAGKGTARRRYVSKGALICLRLDAEGLNQLPLGFRKRVFKVVLAQPRSKFVEPVGAVRVDVALARRELAQRLRMLHRAKHVVGTDPEIMGGAPVVRGTRIPVQLLADMVAQGASAQEIAAGYPSLTAEQVELAVFYAQARPRRGRPAAQPWQGGTSTRKVAQAISVSSQ
jgi:uncharacterized protein (DUF433 family)